MAAFRRLLRPRTVAVIGGAAARRVIEQFDRMGFAGEIWPVHPAHGEILGRPCFTSVAALPGVPDAAFVGVNRHLTVPIVAELARRGAGDAICHASGFLEAAAEVADGARLQDDLVAAAGAMPIVGPNCYGLVNALDGAPLWPDQHGLAREARGVAVVSQSSNIAVNLSMQTRGLPIAYLITAGNQAQTGLSDLAMGVLEDPRVTALGLDVEGFDDCGKVERLAARAGDLGKHVVALKVGKTEDGRRAMVSHTAALVGGDAAAGALLRRLGIGRVHGLPEFIEALKLLHVHGPLGGFDLCSMSCSGGEASLMADAAQHREVHFPPLDPARRRAVKDTLGEIAAVANPLDYHTFIWGDEARQQAAFSAMMGAGFDLSMVVLDFPRADRCDDADWRRTLAATISAAKRTGLPAAIVSSLADTMPETVARDLIDAGVAPLCTFDGALAAAEAAARIGRAWAAPPPPPLLPARRCQGATVVLDEAEAKRDLAAFAVHVPDGGVAANPREAAAVADWIGYPVALKGLGILHKTEVGAVELGLNDRNAVHRAAGAMSGLAARFLVERMAPPPVAELIVGAFRDPVVGLVLSVGSGGVLAELTADAALLILPTRMADISEVLALLKVFRLIEGYRGRPRGDAEAAVSAIAAIARYAEAHAEDLEELDVNPLLALPEGAGVVAVDALIRKRKDG